MTDLYEATRFFAAMAAGKRREVAEYTRGYRDGLAGELPDPGLRVPHAYKVGYGTGVAHRPAWEEIEAVDRAVRDGDVL